MLAAHQVSKSFGSRAILQGVSLRIEPGRIVTLIGPNGAGKTTLVRILLGLIEADSGRVERLPRLRVGYMPQRLGVHPTLPLTVVRFLRLGVKVDAAEIEATLSRLRIGHIEQQQMIAISGGELQRVLLARALLQRPQLLVLDEPAQGVDLAGQAELYQLIGSIRDEIHCGVLMISHDLQLVMSATDEVICLNHHVCCHGEPEHVSNDPAFIELFGPNLSEQLAVYTHDHNHEHDIAGHIKPSES
ncbi:MAG: zinc ABC transporter ATP-binding protein ZnuC [Pseudohongiellaceae bacterium]